MITFIYALIDPRTDEIRYIGKTVSPKRRLREHKNQRSGAYCSAWVASLVEAGYSPAMRILEAIPNSDGAEAERWWIAEGNNLDWRLTNLTDGGDGAPGMSDERKQYLSQLFTGRTISDEQRAQISAALQGHAVSDETRQKIAASKRGQSHPNPHSEETRLKMSTAHTGKKRIPHSEATKAKMRAARLGKPGHAQSEETRAKLSEANAGKTLSDEHKAKISAAHIARRTK